MHGLVFAELERYVTRGHGAEQWRRIVAEAGVTPRVFVALGTYPDAELMKLVQGASTVTKTPVTQLLEGFGEFMAPKLFTMYRTVIAPEWRTLDLVENTEQVIHTVVRSRGGTPPVLSAQRQDATHLVVTYASRRKLCALARGIIRGIAQHYREDISILEPTCMLRAGKVCRLELTRGPAPGAKT
jgi:hypothetical protein